MLRRLVELVVCAEKSLAVALVFAAGSLTAAHCEAQIVRFRMDTEDGAGNVVNQVQVGDHFVLRVFAEDVRMQTTGGVFAGFLDVSYDANLATVDGDVTYGEIYQNVKRGDLTVPGTFNDIGAVSSNGPLGIGIDPIGIGEHLLFQIPMRATAVGDLVFTGTNANNSPFYDVLVYNSNDVVNPLDIDFGGADVRIEFGQARLAVQAVPEPGACTLALMGIVGARALLRSRRVFAAR
jgi:hypothetical protein